MTCHNGAVTVEREVQSPPSSNACTGGASAKLEPRENVDLLIRDNESTMTHGTAEPAELEQASAAPGKPSTIREFERSLRGLGFSQREAKHIALHGFKPAHSEHEDLNRLAEKLQELADIFKESKSND